MLLPAGGKEPNTHENAARRSRDTPHDAEQEAEPQDSRQEAKQEVASSSPVTMFSLEPCLLADTVFLLMGGVTSHAHSAASVWVTAGRH